MVYVLLIMPLGGFGLFSAITRGIAVPLFISGEMMKTPVSAVLYGTGIAALAYVNLRLIFTFPLLVIEGRNPSAAVSGSIIATRRQSLGIAAMIAVVGVVAAATTTAVTEAVVLAASLVDRVFPAASTAAASVGYGIATVATAVIVSFTLVLILHSLTAAYRRALDVRPIAVADRPEPPHRRGSRRRSNAAALAAVVTVGSMAAVSVSAVPPAEGSPAKASAPAIPGTKVIAHRGFVGGGVENTLSALEAAAAINPDYVEIDAQETRDGSFILSHDVNLWLVSGRNVNTYELTLQEAEAISLSVGGYTDRMVSMTDYVRRAEELGVTLLIELKIHGYESPDVMDRFLAELDALGSTEKHIYHSLDDASVAALKAKRPGLTVGRTVAANVRAFSDSLGDFLVVEQSFLALQN